MRMPKLAEHTMRLLEQELDRVADKHGIEEPLRLMPSIDEIFDEEDDDEDGYGPVTR